MGGCLDLSVREFQYERGWPWILYQSVFHGSLLFFFFGIRVHSRFTRQEETLRAGEKGSTSVATRAPPSIVKVVSEDSPFESHRPKTCSTDSAAVTSWGASHGLNGFLCGLEEMALRMMWRWRTRARLGALPAECEGSVLVITTFFRFGKRFFGCRPTARPCSVPWCWHGGGRRIIGGQLRRLRLLQ